MKLDEFLDRCKTDREDILKIISALIISTHEYKDDSEYDKMMKIVQMAISIESDIKLSEYASYYGIIDEED